jgi:hypothetical protein
MICNEYTQTCKIEDIFVGPSSPICGQLVNPSNFQAEQLLYDSAFKDLINNYGIPINYYVNTFDTLSADILYGEHPTKVFKGPFLMQMYVELTENAINLSRFGFASDDTFTGYLHIDTFTSTMSALVNYSQFNQMIEPKSGDIIELAALGCDRPNGRGSKLFEVSERVDQDIASLNPLLGHYVYRLKAKRFEYSFEPGLSGEQANQQVYDNTFAGKLTSNIQDEIAPTESKSYPGDADSLSKEQVYDMSANNTDIYGGYYS